MRGQKRLHQGPHSTPHLVLTPLPCTSCVISPPCQITPGALLLAFGNALLSAFLVFAVMGLVTLHRLFTSATPPVMQLDWLRDLAAEGQIEAILVGLRTGLAQLTTRPSSNQKLRSGAN